MQTVHARNVNEAYAVGMNMIKKCGVPEPSRYGDVLVMPDPVTTTYTNPTERVLFNAKRDANPFFHFLEGLWMISGRNDVEWITKYNSSFKKFSDDGVTFHGAYGWRWRKHFKVDQLTEIIQILIKNPADRRAYISMWDPDVDLNKEGLDFPCNTGIAFRINNDALHMTVFNRSNDAIWGAYGANAVHMSMMQEYIATTIGVAVGKYHQVANNFHAYTEVLDKTGVPDPHPMDPYDTGEVIPYPMIQNNSTWHIDLMNFMADPLQKEFYNNEFFYEVAQPIAEAATLFKQGELVKALNSCQYISAPDWNKSCTEWVKRRIHRKEERDAKQTTERKRNSVAHDTNY
jgi:hypothetical protein|tara:strand:+ start:2235 stop:3269 length:1035 start_codon:yes stop_codon:yes gene_type:complete